VAVSEVYSGGWRATVDGDDMEVLSTNHVLREVPTPAGKHRIELRYDPWSLRIGIPISAVSSVAMAVVFVAMGLSALKRRGAIRQEDGDA
jgi:uncharacterized membrane protein YfhO